MGAMQPVPPERDTIPFPELVRAIERDRQSCSVHVDDGVFEGDLRFENGALDAAVFGGLRGRAALSAMLISDPLHYSVVEDLGLPARVELADTAPSEPDTPLSTPLPDGLWQRTELAEPLATGSDTPLSTPVPDLPRWIADGSQRPLGKHATLHGLGMPPLPVAESASEPQHTMRPGPLPGVAPERAEDLRSWAERISSQYVHSAGRPAEKTSESNIEDIPVPVQNSMVPARFSRDRSTWIAVALAIPLLVALIYRSLVSSETPAPEARAPTPMTVVASTAPVIAPALVAASADNVPTAPSGSLAPTIILRMLIALDGTVKAVAVQSPRPGLGLMEKQAMEAARSYRFRPAMQDGRPVEHWLTLPLSFRAAQPERTIVIKGSDTIGATLGPAWARGLEKTQPGLHVKVDALGSSTGFVGLIDGSADVAMSSRAVRTEELAFAERLGVQLREAVVAYDGVAVIVHPDNPLRKLDIEELARVFAQRVTSWKDLSGADAPIHVLGRPSYSGTHSFLSERMLAALGPGGGFGPTVESIESTKDVVARVANDVNAIGYVSVGQMGPSVRALSVANGPRDSAVTPTSDSIRDGSYPISRPLFLYSRADSEYAARAWVDYALSPAGQTLVESSGFVPIQSPLTSSLAAEVPAPHVDAADVARVFFDPGSSTIETSSRPELLAAAAALRSGKTALVVGHADSQGKREDNERLAQSRADAVARQLRRYGKEPGSVSVEVAAASHPLASNTTADGRKSNRRVDIIIQSR